MSLVVPHGSCPVCIFSQSHTSDYCETNLVVSQGSNLGPLLSYLYIKDIKGYLSNSKALRLLLADDLQIYVQVPANQVKTGIDMLSDLGRMVVAWAELNHITLKEQ